LRVSSRTSAFSLKGKSLDAKEVGQRLGVTRVIDGSLRREGSRVRIAVRLADARSGYQLWSTAFDREVAGMLATQEELARAIAGALRVRLGAGESVASPGSSVDDPAAYDLYLRGRYHWHRRTEADLRAAVAAFEEAVRRAPDYARAWAGLADAYAILGFYDWGRPSEFFPKAREAALRAREADELRGEAEATLGYVAFYHDWDWPAAEASFREAIRLEPRSSKAHQWYANFLTGMGRFDEAEREMRAATELEPLSLIANAALCWVWYNASRFDDAVRQCSGTLELDSTFMLARLWRGWAWTGVGRWDSATGDAESAVRSTGRGTLALASLAYATGGGGDRAGAGAILEELRLRSRERYEPAYEIAKAALGAGSKEEALDWLERALADRAHSMVFLEVDPQLAPLRGDDRFKELVRKVGLP
jgi:tetratricopeptide (TPR) repeat protein